ncbi:LPS export ABC transporter permease LptG [Psychromarinibacter sp. C21-152]|uniref:LPS export ABC transporter permease LptG n=1 Tax=Psychromarinibacter sediminicola TaxID=3033385 RepID=A0AAE3NSL4_9RHOB|nr:LPS export ABC transporter permease LptG [Psychromarinibacter sediminicola]MDF0600884.1 LPS export ABC transporter permease LptG [Psychromarinibacter sediminicola]
MILHLYFARRFLMSFLLVFTVFLGLYVLIDMVEQIRKFDSDTVGFWQIVKLTLLNMPQGMYQILPLIMILATLLLFLTLARTSELVVTRASGRSALRSLVSPVLVAMAIGAVSVGLFNPIVAATSKQYELLAGRLTGDAASVLSISREGLWLRQGGPEGQTVIHAESANLEGTALFGVTFLAFGPEGTPQQRIEAQSARLSPGAWEVQNAKVWRLSGTDNPERDARSLAAMEVPSDLTQEQIQDSFGAPASVPIWELPGFIAQLERAGFSARTHKVWLQMELSQPLLMAAMVLVAAGFTMRHTRFGRTGLMVLISIGMGFGIYFLRNFAQILGDNGQLPVALAAWTVPVAALMLSLGILLNLEDG